MGCANSMSNEADSVASRALESHNCICSHSSFAKYWATVPVVLILRKLNRRTMRINKEFPRADAARYLLSERCAINTELIKPHRGRLMLDNMRGIDRFNIRLYI